MPVHIPSFVRIFVFLLSLLTPSDWLLAQSFRLPQPGVITDRQGLPQAFVPSILQDKQGFIWVATRDGLCRYDGQRFKVFQPDPDGRPSLSFAGLNQIELDHHGKIWIVSEQGDIDQFDPRSETFVNLSRQAAFRRLTKIKIAYSLRTDRQDRLWLISLGDGVICWDLKKNKGQWFRHQPDQPGSLRSNYVTDVVEAADGQIWLATAKGLNRFDEATRSFVDLQHQPGNPQSLPEDTVYRVYSRPTGEIMALSRRYLTLLQPRTGQLRSYRMPAQGNHVDGHRITMDRQGAVYFDQFNTLFRFTDQQGVQVLGRWNQLNDGCSSLFVDCTNVLWIGTAGSGIRTYNLQPLPFQTRRYSRNFYQDLLTNDSLGLPPVWRVIKATLSGLSSYNFRSAFDSSGRFWFNVGTSDLYRLDRKTRQAERLPLPVTFRWNAPGYIPCPLTTDPQGRVWAVYDTTAYWFDELKQHWTAFPYPISGQSTNPITELVVDNQFLWLASRSGGLWRMNRRNGQLHQFVNRPGDRASLSSNSLYSISADPDDPNRLWIGTFGNGLCLFDKKTGRVLRFTKSNGLPNNVVYSVKADRQGYLWMGTNKGLCRMNRRTFRTETFTRDDGIMADEFNSYHYVQFPDGKILMGGLEGFTRFDPRQIGQDAFEPVVELTELQINNQIIQPDIPGMVDPDTASAANRSILGTLPIQATNQLTLAYNQNYLTVQFAALQFNQPGKNRYRYRLKGLETDWKQVDRPEAIYTNLPAGDYVLLLNASNTSGRWSRHVRMLAITILPPFWETWWAFGLYFLLGLGVVLGLLQIYLNRLRLNQAIELRQKESEQLRAVDAIKTNFFTNITHEFRTPLTLILGPTEQLMSQETEPKNRRRLLQTIEQNAHQLLRLINQLLDLSKLEASVMSIHESRGNLTEFIRHWLQPLRDQATSQGLSLVFRSEVTGEYWFDAEKLERIVYNLTANALKFTKNGSIQVSLETASGHIRLTVADTGMGISAEHLPHIFDRFYQVGPQSVGPRSVGDARFPAGTGRPGSVDQSNPATPPGTGIGLALVHELVQLQGGQISVESLVDQGTTFVVELPYRQADSVAVMPEVVIPASREVTTPVWTALDESNESRVLIVEDNDELAQFIANSLPLHYRIRKAVNGLDGLEQALEYLPDLIISDVMMPGMDGFTLCDRLKTDLRTSHIPVILLTAKASVDSRIEGLSQGADDYLTKPFQVSELQLRVRNQLVSKQRQREWVRASLANPNPSDSRPATEPADPFLNRLYELLESNLSDPRFGIEQMMLELGLSRTSLFRKVKALTDLSANDLLRNYRLKRAAQLLRTGQSVNQTAYEVGFESPAYFSKCFRELYQLTPSEFAAQP
ncbi:hybrid sensor histidine kinase/response regulator transcription factor [Larkinella rosea]|uniref:histidine kinase n=1 Tax=Larkinella rosea TaxID=2025312 RepID=A0A3P1BBA6_9BACT|nr:ATP-binding protein [Larkinella rosea]RRA98122.1 hybrid sensor histidine kinase/response regulator [Larkinella rosea]